MNQFWNHIHCWPSKLDFLVSSTNPMIFPMLLGPSPFEGGSISVILSGQRLEWLWIPWWNLGKFCYNFLSKILLHWSLKSEVSKVDKILVFDWCSIMAIECLTLFNSSLDFSFYLFTYLILLVWFYIPWIILVLFFWLLLSRTFTKTIWLSVTSA